MRNDQVRHRVSLITGHEEVVPDMLRRLLIVLLLIALVTVVLWLDREGLSDESHGGNPPNLLDVFYFTVVTVTTVGYGDIVPVTQRARLISTLIVTPIRIFILILFIGTAYQLALQRYREAYQMRRVQNRLDQHIIICGYGVKGRSTVTELRSFGYEPDRIVVIDLSAEVAEDAARDGLISFSGNATSDAAFRAAAIEKANCVIVDVDRDDTTVLICLTAKNLNPNIYVVAAAKEAENVPLIYRSGADVVVAPPVAGGRMLAMATQLKHAPRFLDDILTFGKGLDFGEITIKPSEAGLTMNELPELQGKLPIGAYHRKELLNFQQLANIKLEAGDVIIYLAAK